ncbi:MAG: hypothetical protein ABJF88_13430 [Rhodothermales bacterium]
MGRLLRLALCLTLLPFIGCGSDSSGDEPRDSDAARDVRDAERTPQADPDDIAGSIADAFGGAFGGEGRAAETVDFRTLRDLLPEELDDFERTDASGERTGIAGFSFSQAEGEYRSDDGERRISLQIVDAGGIGQMTMLGASWMQLDVDRESSDGYERTTEFEGYPAFEKLRSGERPRSELQLVVADRFFVSANGQNVEMDDLKDALEEVDFDELKDLRDVGVEK